MLYDEAALQKVRELRLLIDRCDAWLFELIQPFMGQRILEIGCGLGNLLRLLADRTLVFGTDISQESVDYVKHELGQNDNINAAVLDVTDPSFLQLKSFRFDTVVSLNVFEHIKDDTLALEHVFEVLAPGGKLVLIVPAHQWLYGPMDSSIGHYRRYTVDDLGAKLRRTGFRVCSQRYVNPIGALGWFVNGRILRRRTPPVAQLNTFNKIMPLISTIDRNFDLSFGLSVVSVSERPI
jgi:SAM-dependent methyltransferase